MSVENQIETYIKSQAESRQKVLNYIHQRMRLLMPDNRLWFLDGKNEEGKVISNPNIGYGECTLNYTNGKPKQFYKIGLSSNSSGISIYVMGLSDKNFLKKNLENSVGKAKITSYCIHFKKLEDIAFPIIKNLILKVVSKN